MVYEPQAVTSLQDFFRPKSQRGGAFVHCYRLNGYSQEIAQVLTRYHKEAQETGGLVLERLPNPSQENLNYYQQMIGEDFHMNLGFFTQKLSLWLPRLSPAQIQVLATAIYDTLFDIQKIGKNSNILKNIFIKFLCWMYYRFEALLRQLGGDRLPKILYEGEVSNHELRLIAVLSRAGCDVLLLQYQGDQAYKALDPENAYTFNFDLSPLSPFPEGFSIASLQKDQAKAQRLSQLCRPSAYQILPNHWQKSTALSDILTPGEGRGASPQEIFPCYRALLGVKDKVNYLPELYNFYQELKSTQRPVVVLDQLPPATPEEIAAITRKSYQKEEDLLQDLGRTIQFSASQEVEGLLRKAFLDRVTALAQETQGNLNRLTSQAVTLLCLLKRYQGQLFHQWSPRKFGCLIYLNGGCHPNERSFLAMLTALPLDLLLLNPDLQSPPQYPPLVLVEEGSHSLQVQHFPTGAGDVQMGTVAYHAERELDSLLYSESGMYRNQQYQKANAIALKTMYEEIPILWDTESKFRPNFDVVGQVVSVPTLFAKISGVKEEKTTRYWDMIRSYLTPETLVLTPTASQNSGQNSALPLKGEAFKFWKSGKLQRKEILSHPGYGYGFLRDECQHHILDKLEGLLTENLIKGTGVGGMEYHIIARILSLDQRILQLIGRQDFTQKTSKLVYVHTQEVLPSVDDAIVLAFLHLVTFDILLFVPTGYQGVEAHYTKKILEEHQVGPYQYNLQAPDFSKSQRNRPSLWGNKRFKRGG